MSVENGASTERCELVVVMVSGLCCGFSNECYECHELVPRQSVSENE